MSAILELARSSALLSVAEGIENMTQLDLLASLGCDRAQGYYLGRPQSPEEITTLLAHADRHE